MADAATPEQAILDELSAPLGRWEPAGEPVEGSPQAGIVRGGRSDVVDLASVRFVKQRSSARRRVIFVAYEAVHPRFGPDPLPGTGIYPVEPADGGGWRTIGHAGGLGGEPQWSTPRLNLGGGQLPGGGMYAGGTVHGAGHDVAHVQLRFPDGTVLSDDTEGGVALFITDADLGLHATVVLLDPAGAELACHPAFPE